MFWPSTVNSKVEILYILSMYITSSSTLTLYVIPVLDRVYNVTFTAYDLYSIRLRLMNNI